MISPRTTIFYFFWYFFIFVSIPTVILGFHFTAEWNQLAQELRVKGQPITFAEIESLRSDLPEGKNSARIIEYLTNELHDLADEIGYESDLFSEVFFEGASREHFEEARAFVHRHRGLLVRLRGIDKMRQGRFELDYTRHPIEFELLTDDSTSVRAASKLIHLHQKIQLFDGDFEAARNDIILQCRLARTLDGYPNLIGRLVQIAASALAVGGLENLLRVGEISENELLRLDKELRTLEETGTFRWALLGEGARFVETCEAMISGRVPLQTIESDDPDWNGRQVLAPFWLRLPVFLGRMNQIKSVQLLTPAIEKSSNPAELIEAAKTFDSQVHELSPAYFLVKILLGTSITRAAELNGRILAYCDVPVPPSPRNVFDFTTKTCLGHSTISSLISCPTFPLIPSQGTRCYSRRPTMEF